MNATLLMSIITITLALIFYTIGVWMEKIQKRLKPIHLAFFILGLICDSTGTALMTRMADHTNGKIIGVHGITGALAIVLMFIHAIWAIVVLAKKDEKAQQSFHKFSIFVWLIWLIPYFIGMFMGMGNKSKAEAVSNVDYNSLVVTETVDLQYAEQYKIDKLSEYSKITIGEAEYLLVPENQDIPYNLPENMTVLKQPFDKTYLVSTSVMDLLDKNGVLDNVRLSGTKEVDWYIDSAKNAMANGEILYAGKYSAPDYELILSEGCNLAIENTMIYHNPEAKEKLEELGIPVLVEKSSYETHPLGRLEWIKLYGYLYGAEDTANEYFSKQIDLVKSIEDKSSSLDFADENVKRIAFFSITSNGSVTVRKPGDYIAKMIEIAGGKYALSDYLVEEENSLSTMNIQMEDFYAAAADADIIIYNSTIEGEINSLNDLAEKSSVLKDFKAYKDGNVYCTSKNFFQESTGLAEFIVDLNKVLNNQEDCTYLYKLK